MRAQGFKRGQDPHKSLEIGQYKKFYEGEEIELLEPIFYVHPNKNDETVGGYYTIDELPSMTYQRTHLAGDVLHFVDNRDEEEGRAWGKDYFRGGEEELMVYADFIKAHPEIYKLKLNEVQSFKRGQNSYKKLAIGNEAPFKPGDKIRLIEDVLFDEGDESFHTRDEVRARHSNLLEENYVNLYYYNDIFILDVVWEKYEEDAKYSLPTHNLDRSNLFENSLGTYISLEFIEDHPKVYERVYTNESLSFKRGGNIHDKLGVGDWYGEFKYGDAIEVLVPLYHVWMDDDPYYTEDELRESLMTWSEIQEILDKGPDLRPGDELQFEKDDDMEYFEGPIGSGSMSLEWVLKHKDIFKLRRINESLSFKRGGNPYKELNVGLSETEHIIKSIKIELDRMLKDHKGIVEYNLKLYNDAELDIRLKPLWSDNLQVKPGFKHYTFNITYKHDDWHTTDVTTNSVLLDTKDGPLEKQMNDYLDKLQGLSKFLDIFSKEEYTGRAEIQDHNSKTIGQ